MMHEGKTLEQHSHCSFALGLLSICKSCPEGFGVGVFELAAGGATATES